MEQGLIDIRNKARELSLKFGELSPYDISCETLIAIINRVEHLENLGNGAESEIVDIHSVRWCPYCKGWTGSSKNGKCVLCRRKRV